jgi:hypothetical protein
VGEVEGLTCILGCRVASLPMKYFGLSLEASYKATTIWNGIIQKMEHRLAGWKRLYLSKGGMMNMLTSTISNLPMYCLSLPYYCRRG